MNTCIYNSPQALGKAAGQAAAQLIREAINSNGSANIILATGTSQFETLKELIAAKDINWSKVVMFHLDEYISLPITHPASFRKYLQERFLIAACDFFFCCKAQCSSRIFINIEGTIVMHLQNSRRV
jgi:glucosamine-6-phosphate deaminase